MSENDDRPEEIGDSSAPEVRAARITARQAIIVALITAFAGLAAVLIPNFFNNQPDESVTQRWITVESVTFLEQTSRPVNFRLIIRANGQAYSYPSRRAFMTSGAQMPRESFPIPAGSESVDVSFEIFYLGIREIITDMRPQLTSEEVIEVSEFPYRGRYMLREVVGMWIARPSVVVEFTVSMAKP